jgi:uncharacterized SAM-binding protein YcdF (DUF218 family)
LSQPFPKTEDPIAAITEFIFLETPISSADIILIPGSHRPQLIERAAELYHCGLAPVILPSGGANPHLPGLTEWAYLEGVGVSLGVPEAAFLKEDEAQHTLENAELSWKAIVKATLEVRTAILVCKAFHARRVHMTYSAAFPEHIRFMVSPVHDERDIRKDNWFMSEIGIRKVMGEIEKIGRYFDPRQKTRRQKRYE